MLEKRAELLPEFGVRERCRGLSTRGAAAPRSVLEAQTAVSRHYRFMKHSRAEQAKR